MKEKLIIIGANEYQYPLVKTANEIGFETHVFAWEEGAIAKEIASVFYPISITKKEEILTKVKDLNAKGVCTIGTDLAVPTVNFIANNLGLVGNSAASVLKSTNKFYMRNALKKNGIPIPWFRKVKSFTEIEIDTIPLPAIIKPSDRSGSRGILKVEQPEDFEEAINNAIEYSYEKTVLIEEYIDGEEYSVEMISQNGNHYFLQLTKKITTGAPNFVEVAHLAPFRLEENKEEQLILIIKEALDALEIKNGASHSELKINHKGEIKIIEIGSRMGGDYIGSHMVEITTGIDYIKKIIDVSIGAPLELIYRNQGKNALVNFIFNKNDLKKYKEIRDKYGQYFVKEFIKDEFNENITDSSLRNGYYIIGVDSSDDWENIMNILNYGG